MKDPAWQVRDAYHSELDGITVNGHTVKFYHWIVGYANPPYIRLRSMGVGEIAENDDSFNAQVEIELAVGDHIRKQNNAHKLADDIINEITKKFVVNSGFPTMTDFYFMSGRYAGSSMESIPKRSGTVIERTVRIEHDVAQKL